MTDDAQLTPEGESFRLRMRVINHIRERLAAAKHKKDKSIFLSDEAWALVLQGLEKLG